MCTYSHESVIGSAIKYIDIFSKRLFRIIYNYEKLLHDF